MRFNYSLLFFFFFLMAMVKEWPLKCNKCSWKNQIEHNEFVELKGFGVRGFVVIFLSRNYCSFK